MLFPVRCFTCGKVISQKYDLYKQLKEAGMPIPALYKEISITKLCCKRMFSGHVEVYECIEKYDQLPEKVTRTQSVDKNRHYKAI